MSKNVKCARCSTTRQMARHCSREGSRPVGLCPDAWSSTTDPGGAAARSVSKPSMSSWPACRQDEAVRHPSGIGDQDGLAAGRAQQAEADAECASPPTRLEGERLEAANEPGSVEQVAEHEPGRALAKLRQSVRAQVVHRELAGGLRIEHARLRLFDGLEKIRLLVVGPIEAQAQRDLVTTRIHRE
eukprot:scaffold8243_cov129-Isochrysis_galbana.AAC.3